MWPRHCLVIRKNVRVVQLKMALQQSSCGKAVKIRSSSQYSSSKLNQKVERKRAREFEESEAFRYLQLVSIYLQHLSLKIPRLMFASCLASYIYYRSLLTSCMLFILIIVQVLRVCLYVRSLQLQIPIHHHLLLFPLRHQSQFCCCIVCTGFLVNTCLAIVVCC